MKWWNLPQVTISSLQRTTKPLLESEIACVLKQSRPAFYTVSPSRMAELLEAEESAKDRLKTLQMIHEGKLDAGDLINLYEVSK